MSVHERPLVTIGMPVYNCEHTVAASIASMLNQTFRDWELIVFDDGSRDRTLDVVRGFSDPRVRVIEGGCNRGLPGCLNEIVSRCESELFARMDGDDIAYPSRFEQQVDFLRQHPEVDLVGGWVTIFRSDGTPLGVRRGKAAHEQICANAWAGISMAHPTWMGRTKWFRSHPYAPDAVRMEDWELLSRAYSTSRFANLQEVLLGYREDSLSLGKIFTARVNKCRVMLRRARKDRLPWQAFGGVAGECAKFLMDAVAIGTGMNHMLLRHRTLPISVEEKAAWQEVFDGAHRTMIEEAKAIG